MQTEKESELERCFREQGSKLRAIAWNVLGNEHDVQDTLQEAFVLATSGVHRFRGRSRINTWVYRIVLNAALMRSRFKRRERDCLSALPGGDFDRAAAAIASERTEPWSDLEQREVRSRLLAHLATLPEIYRRVVDLRDLQERPTTETARLLGISKGAVKVRLHRARKALRARWTH